MIVLGINGGTRPGYQDAAAVLAVDGKIVAAVEEERLSRIKFAPGQLPMKSVEWILQSQNLSILEIDLIASHGSTWGDKYQLVLQDHFRNYFGGVPEIKRFHHHDCHAASAYYASGFDEAMILTVDGSGDGVSTQLASGINGKIETLDRYSRPNSLGIFYSAFTQFCGFTRDSDEYKLMGLAAYGDPFKFNFDWFMKWSAGKYEVFEEYLKAVPPGAPQPSRQEIMYNEKFIDRLGAKRLPGTSFSKYHENIAASAQRSLEKVLIRLVEELHTKTELTKLCLAGGVALNCAANKILANLEFIDDIYVQPASSDAGVALGAAYLGSQGPRKKLHPMTDVYLGPAFSDVVVGAELSQLGISFRRLRDRSAEAARLIHEDKVIAWFQDACEFGPRALGNRSILANPMKTGMNDLVNRKIKFRESFRPLCPSVLQSDFETYFEGRPASSPYMTINYEVKEEMRDLLPAVTHVDGSARVQTVDAETNPFFHDLLLELKKLSGHGIVLNTSFNRNNEPIAASPKDAVSIFFGSGLDALIIGDCLIEKVAK